MVGRIGGHIFYSWKGATGSAGAFTQAYSGFEPSRARMTPLVEPMVVENSPRQENPALGGPTKGKEALQDPSNADLLNYKAAENDHAAARPDESEVVRAIKSAL
jgi:hypothetical protein